METKEKHFNYLWYRLYIYLGLDENKARPEFNYH